MYVFQSLLFCFTFYDDYWNILSSTSSFLELSLLTLILGSNMSSGVTVPSFGKKFAKLRQCEQFEVQENSSGNKASAWTNFKNSFAWLTGMKQLIFYFNKFFCSGQFLVIFSDLMDQKNGRSQQIHNSGLRKFIKKTVKLG